MKCTIHDITDKVLVEAIDRIDSEIENSNFGDAVIYLYTSKNIAEQMFPEGNYADINILISASNRPYNVVGSEAIVDEIIVSPMPMVNYNIREYNIETGEFS